MKKFIYSLFLAMLLIPTAHAIEIGTYGVYQQFLATPMNRSTVDAPFSTVTLKTGNGDLADAKDCDASLVYVVDANGTKVSTVTLAAQTDDWTSIVINFDTPITVSGDYTVIVKAGALKKFGATSTALYDEDVEIYYTVNETDPTPAEPVSNTDYSLTPTAVTPADGSEKNFDDLIMNLTFPSTTKLKSGAKAVVTSAIEGYDYSAEVDIKDCTNLISGLFACSPCNVAEKPTQNGAYKVTFPKGTFGDAAYIADNNEGVANAELSYTYICNDLATGEDTKVTSVTVGNVVYQPSEESGEWAETLGTTYTNELAAFATDSKLVFNTDNNLAVGYIYAQVIDQNPLSEDEAIVRTMESHARRTLPEDRGTYWQDDEAPFLSIPLTLTFQQGHTYTLKATLYDFETPPYSRTELATYSCEIAGQTAAFVYANATLVGDITPDQKTHIINSTLDSSFEMHFSDYVQVNVEKSSYYHSDGKSVAISADDFAYSDDHKSITFTFPESEISNATSGVMVRLYIEDADGHPVYNGSDMKEASHFEVSYKCYVGAPDLQVLPASGVVASIQDIYVSCPTGPSNGMINVFSPTITGYIKVMGKDRETVYAEFTADPETTETGVNSDGEYPTTLKFSLDEPITTPGVYVIDIPAEYFALGSEFSAATSKETFATYTIEGEPESNVVYDFQPISTDVSVNSENVEIKLQFAEDVYMNDYKFNENYMLDAQGEVVADAQIEYAFDEDYTVTYYEISGLDLSNGNVYTLVVSQGTWGSEEYDSSNFLAGYANAEFKIEISDNISDGIENVAVNNRAAVGAVYNLQGVLVSKNADARTLRQLPAGIYIVAGRKVVIR